MTLFKQMKQLEGVMAHPKPVYEDVVRIAEECGYPHSELEQLTCLLGVKPLLKGFCSQGEDVFRESFLAFLEVGAHITNEYIVHLGQDEMIGLPHLRHDFARAPSSLARIVKFIDNKEIVLDEIPCLVSILKEAVGIDAYEKGFAPWSLYYFLVALKKIQNIGQDEFCSALSMVKKTFPTKYLGEAYSQGYLWFVESIVIFSEIGIDRSRVIIKDVRDMTEEFYFLSLFSHNPRSFSKYIKMNTEEDFPETICSFYGQNLSANKLLEKIRVAFCDGFPEKEYLHLAPSELIAFLLDGIALFYNNLDSDELILHLKRKYFSPLSKNRVYGKLRTIGPEVEIQKGLKEYDVDTAHMVAFFLLIQSSGDALIEFPLGPARYHGTLSDIVRAMRHIKVGGEFLIPDNQIIPLDVSISVPHNLINLDVFRRKATVLRVVNDMLYTADNRLQTAFSAEPQDQSGIRYKLGLAKGETAGRDLVENRSGNLITQQEVEGVTEPLKCHERSFRFYQLMYSALVATFVDLPSRSDLDEKLAIIIENFLTTIDHLFLKYEIQHLLNIDSNQGNAFIFISKARSMSDGFTDELADIVEFFLCSIDKAVCSIALKNRIGELQKNCFDIESQVLDEINVQIDVDKSYGDVLAASMEL